MNEWQPIETAPRNGTWVLLTGGRADFDDYNHAIATWPPSVVAFWDRDSWGDETWALAFWDGAWRTSYTAPTHWMPLPDPPPEA